MTFCPWRGQIKRVHWSNSINFRSSVRSSWWYWWHSTSVASENKKKTTTTKTKLLKFTQPTTLICIFSVLKQVDDLKRCMADTHCVIKRIPLNVIFVLCMFLLLIARAGSVCAVNVRRSGHHVAASLSTFSSPPEKKTYAHALPRMHSSTCTRVCTCVGPPGVGMRLHVRLRLLCVWRHLIKVSFRQTLLRVRPQAAW